MSFVTDITIICKDKGERCPPNYRMIARTPNGHDANLHKRSMFGSDVYLCFDCNNLTEEIITDLLIVAIEKETVPNEFTPILTTPEGHSANLNKKSGSKRLVLCVRKQKRALSEQAITDICVVIPSKGERVPGEYSVVERDVNDGSFGADSTYICYRKQPLNVCNMTAPSTSSPLNPSASLGYLQPQNPRPLPAPTASSTLMSPNTLAVPPPKAPKRSSTVYEELEAIPIEIQSGSVSSEVEGHPKNPKSSLFSCENISPQDIVSRFSYGFELEKSVLGATNH